MVGSRAGLERSDCAGCGRDYWATEVWWCPGPEVHRTGTGTETRGAMRWTTVKSRTFFPARCLSLIASLGDLDEWGALGRVHGGEGTL